MRIEMERSLPERGGGDGAVEVAAGTSAASSQSRRRHNEASWFPSGKMKVEKEPSGSENVVTLTAQELQSHLWEAANILRGSAVDRTDWKGYILPLLFFKRICDVWDEETSEVADIYGDVVATEHAGPPNRAGRSGKGSSNRALRRGKEQRHTGHGRTDRRRHR